MIKPIISHRCLFPYGAFLFSTKQVAEIARDLGYQGVEFLPTWRFVWEIARHGKLLAEKETVHSGHRDWRFDRVMERKLGRRSFPSATFGSKPDYLFPPSFLCLRALKAFQKEYGVPVSTTWFSDLFHFSPTELELWGKEQGIDYQGLWKWLNEDSQNRGVVLDTYKFRGFLKSHQLEKQEDQIIKELLPYIREVHFRPGRGGEEMEDVLKGKIRTDSVQILSEVISTGYEGSVVVEFGWPEAGIVLKPSLENLDEFASFHRRLLSFVDDLLTQ